MTSETDPFAPVSNRTPLSLNIVSYNGIDQISLDDPDVADFQNEISDLFDASVSSDKKIAGGPPFWTIILSFAAGGIAAGFLSGVGTDLWSALKRLVVKSIKKNADRLDLPMGAFPSILIGVVMPDITVEIKFGYLAMRDDFTHPIASPPCPVIQDIDVPWDRLSTLSELLTSLAGNRNIPSGADLIRCKFDPVNVEWTITAISERQGFISFDYDKRSGRWVP